MAKTQALRPSLSLTARKMTSSIPVLALLHDINWIYNLYFFLSFPKNFSLNRRKENSFLREGNIKDRVSHQTEQSGLFLRIYFKLKFSSSRTCALFTSNL